jgi:multimeric flavodoxin WrbA
MLHALIINCTLKKSPEPSNTEALIKKALREFRRHDVAVEVIRLVDFTIAPGTSSDQGHGDQWPHILEKIRMADIFIIATPIWMGHTPSTAQQIIERLDAIYSEKDLSIPATGQYVTYNKVGGVLVTGNEDGAHAVASHLLWALSDLGFTIPPNSNAYWVNKSGSSESYIEAGGEEESSPTSMVLIMVHNLMYFARLLQEHPIPTHVKLLTKQAEDEP